MFTPVDQGKEGVDGFLSWSHALSNQDIWFVGFAVASFAPFAGLGVGRTRETQSRADVPIQFEIGLTVLLVVVWFGDGLPRWQWF